MRKSEGSRLLDIWPFGKPRTPGFGISRDYYLSVLVGVARLPSVIEVINPRGDGGAVAGFGAPLQGEANKELLIRPMERGIYALASPDRKTMLRMMVLPKEEAGFQGEAYLASAEGTGSSTELASRIRATWTLAQLTFEAHDPMVYASLRFLLSCAKRLAELTDGVIADPLSRVYKLPSDIYNSDPPDVRDLVSVHMLDTDNQAAVYTLGLLKFALPELEVNDVPMGLKGPAEGLLLSLSQRILQGDLLEVGDKVGPKQARLDVVPGGLDRSRWEGIPCLELLPEKGDIGSALSAWSSNSEDSQIP